MTTEPIPRPTPDPAFTTPSPTPPPPATSPVTSAPVGWVIAAMILFWPTGIPALLASHRAARAIGAADAVTADREASNARRWGIISVIVGAALIVLSILASILWALIAIVAVHDYNGGDWGNGPRWSDERSFDDEVSPMFPDSPGSDR
ncbi:CD225/dispanin family protein [Cellulomonas xylanilytica]|uniref:DUF4190 domain-containing protein n=1 Tax=Cellulomonas xylanilytica TaxID=233583 RepID=A0A510V753_9CELL|nr:CD225/dispanin family protein [Cellulomonas xylanilytica]GEK21761.1 hypothetical protein CXY01_22810 [Cellulomonas xylanilytica]